MDCENCEIAIGDFENFDRKNMENLMKHKLEKMLIFDQKILEVAIAKKMKFRK